jgi:hypothetical protein
MNKMNFLRMNAIPGLIYSFKFERESQTPKTPCPNEKPVRFLDMELPARLLAGLLQNNSKS